MRPIEFLVYSVWFVVAGGRYAPLPFQGIDLVRPALEADNIDYVYMPFEITDFLNRILHAVKLSREVKSVSVEN
jgi:hypothetical protein